MLYFIINPNSSSGNGWKIWEKLNDKLVEQKIEFGAYVTAGKGSAKDYADEITRDDEEKTIVVVGGDGTVNETLCGIRDFSHVTLGYIPAGSSNDLARDMGINTDPEKALDAVLNPTEYVYKDVGVISHGDTVRNFSVSAGIGFDAATCYEADHSKMKKVLNKIGLGKLIYALICIKLLMGLKKRECTITLDDEKTVTYKRFIFVVAMVHRYEGGGLMFCPEADYGDGILDICAIGDISRFKVLRLLPKAYKGGHVNAKGIDIYKAKKIHIKTDSSAHVHTDGEDNGEQDDITITQDVNKLRVILR